MATTPSYVTFGLKIFLFIIECMKFKYSYDMSGSYDTLKHAYVTADSSTLPQSFPNTKTQTLGGRKTELGYQVTGIKLTKEAQSQELPPLKLDEAGPDPDKIMSEPVEESKVAENP